MPRTLASAVGRSQGTGRRPSMRPLYGATNVVRRPTSSARLTPNLAILPKGAACVASIRLRKVSAQGNRLAYSRRVVGCAPSPRPFLGGGRHPLIIWAISCSTGEHRDRRTAAIAPSRPAGISLPARRDRAGNLDGVAQERCCLRRRYRISRHGICPPSGASRICSFSKQMTGLPLIPGKPSGLSTARLSSGILRRCSACFHLDDHVAPLTWSEPRWLPPEPPAETEIATVQDLHPVGDGMPDDVKADGDSCRLLG
jgi:hypothetical protein